MPSMNNWQRRVETLTHRERMGMYSAQDVKHPTEDTQLVSQALQNSGDETIVPTTRESSEEDRENLLKALASPSVLEDIMRSRMVIAAPKLKPPQYERLEVTNGTALDRQLGFPARSVIAHNHTSQYAMFDGARYYIPPGVVGVVLPITSAPQKAVVKWEAPLGTTQPAATTGSLLITEWREDELAFSPGIPTTISGITPGAAGPQVKANSISVVQFLIAAADVLAGFVTAAGTLITVPAGKTWIGSLSIQGVAVVASGGAAVSGAVTIATAGAGVTPAAGVFLRLDINAPVSVAASNGTIDTNNITQQMVTVIAPAGNSVTLTVATVGTAPTNWSATAWGYLQ